MPPAPGPNLITPGRLGGGNVARILLHEETLDPAFVPPRLPHREEERIRLFQRYRDALEHGVPHHHLITGRIGSGKTALAKRVGADLERVGRLGSVPCRAVYVNCWRRASDRTVLLDLVRHLDIELPDRGYSLAEMLDIFEQGLRRRPHHWVVILDEASALVRQETKLIYLLSRSREVGLGSISLLMVTPEDILPFLDAPSRSSFGITHRLELAPYGPAELADILAARAELALRPGAYTTEILEQIARIAAPNGDARFALELLANAAQAAEAAGATEIASDHVRAAKGSIYPTVTEGHLEGLSTAGLLVLLALARRLRGGTVTLTSRLLREAYAELALEYGTAPVSRTTFWRVLRELDQLGLIGFASSGSGEAASVTMDEMPASFLTTLIEERLARGHRVPKR